MKNKKKYPKILDSIIRNAKNEHILDLIFEDNGIKSEEIPLGMCNKNYRDFINFHFKKIKETEEEIFYKFKNKRFVFNKVTKKIKHENFEIVYIDDLLNSYLYNNQFKCYYVESQKFYIKDIKKNKEYLFKNENNKKSRKFYKRTIKLYFLKSKIEKLISQKLNLQIEIKESWITKKDSLRLYCTLIDSKNISFTIDLDKNGINKLYYSIGFYMKYKIDFKNKKTESSFENKDFENEDSNQFLKLFRALGYFNLKDDITIDELLIKLTNDKLVDVIKMNTKI